MIPIQMPRELALTLCVIMCVGCASQQDMPSWFSGRSASGPSRNDQIVQSNLGDESTTEQVASEGAPVLLPAVDDSPAPAGAGAPSGPGMPLFAGPPDHPWDVSASQMAQQNSGGDDLSGRNFGGTGERQTRVVSRVQGPRPATGRLVTEQKVPQPAAARGPTPVTGRQEDELSASRAAVASRAEQRMHYATGLAERGAVYSAQEEFVAVLASIAQSRDAETGTQRHQRALEAGLIALEEASDFAPKDSLSQVSMNLSAVIARHRTTVLKSANANQLTPMIAMQRYYLYAQQQLALAGCNEPVASQALYRIGRLQTLLSHRFDGTKTMAGPKTVALYSAALAVDGRNYMAANELGVLLARCGQPEEARRVLLHGLSVSAQPETSYNLSVVQRQLGEEAAAQQAYAQYEQQLAVKEQRTAGQGDSGAANHDTKVRWVSSETFAQLPNPDVGKPLLKPSDTLQSVAAADHAPNLPPREDETPKKGLSMFQSFFWR